MKNKIIGIMIGFLSLLFVFSAITYASGLKAAATVMGTIVGSLGIGVSIAIITLSYTGESDKKGSR